MTPLRCYNCGLLGHKTQFCPSFGPKYPSPGKTAEDYAKEAQRIANLFAGDIVAEHSHDEGPVLRPKPKRPVNPPSDVESFYRDFPCEWCGALGGEACRSKTTNTAGKAHGARRTLAWAHRVEADGNTLVEPVSQTVTET